MGLRPGPGTPPKRLGPASRRPATVCSSSAGKLPTGSGDRFATVTSNACSARNPPASAAVTVTVVVPPDTGVTDTAAPDAATADATVISDDDAPYVSGSPSGSRNARDTSTRNTPSDTRADRSGIAPAITGGRFGTVTTNACAAGMFEPPASVAVTVTVATPAVRGVTDTVAPDTDTDATAGADDTAP